MSGLRHEVASFPCEPEFVQLQLFALFVPLFVALVQLQVLFRECVSDHGLMSLRIGQDSRTLRCTRCKRRLQGLSCCSFFGQQGFAMVVAIAWRFVGTVATIAHTIVDFAQTQFQIGLSGTHKERRSVKEDDD